MYKILSFYTLTPLHAGSGKEVGIVDLPIQRERLSNHPICYASSVKGAMRQHYPGSETNKGLIFGPETNESSEHHAGCASFTDARLLAFPIRSLRETFVWVTCPLVLERFRRDLEIAGGSLGLPDEIAGFQGEAMVCGTPAQSLLDGSSIVLEEFVVPAASCDEMTAVANELARYLPERCGRVFREKFEKHLVLVSNTLFDEIVTLCTEVVARVSLDEDSKTVKSGPWYEENLPSETLLYSLLAVQKPRKASKVAVAGVSQKADGGKAEDASVPEKADGGKAEEKGKAEPLCGTERDVAKEFSEARYPILQLGGHETIGRGILALKFTEF